MEESNKDELDIEAILQEFGDQPPEPVPEGQPTVAKSKKKEKEPWQKSFLSYLHDLSGMLAGLVLISLLLLRVVVVSGSSMYNTLVDGDYLFVLSNTFYRQPQQGDIVVISKESFDNGAPIVKRVIATEGQTVDIDFTLGIVYVDGKALEEDYTYTPTNRQEGMHFPLTVEEDCIFVLGDNREVSQDSRSPLIGLIHEQEVLGKVFFLFLPGTNGIDTDGQPKEERDWSRIGVVD